MYTLIKAAKYLGVEPWILADKSIAWLEWALVCENAETRAKNQQGSGTEKMSYSEFLQKTHQ